MVKAKGQRSKVKSEDQLIWLWRRKRAKRSPTFLTVQTFLSVFNFSSFFLSFVLLSHSFFPKFSLVYYKFLSSTCFSFFLFLPYFLPFFTPSLVDISSRFTQYTFLTISEEQNNVFGHISVEFPLESRVQRSPSLSTPKLRLLLVHFDKQTMKLKHWFKFQQLLTLNLPQDTSQNTFYKSLHSNLFLHILYLFNL